MAPQLHILKERHVFDPRLIPVAFSKTVRDVLKWVRTCLGAAAPLAAVGRGRNETCSGEGASSWEELGESHHGDHRRAQPVSGLHVVPTVGCGAGKGTLLLLLGCP